MFTFLISRVEKSLSTESEALLFTTIELIAPLEFTMLTASSQKVLDTKKEILSRETL